MRRKQTYNQAQDRIGPAVLSRAMPVTLRDISQIAQTSEATVSLVLNGKQYHRVSQETRRRIEKIAQELGYEPNHQAQRLAGGKAMAIGLLLNDLKNPFFAHYASLIQNRLQPHRYHTIPYESQGNVEREAEVVRMVDRSFCDGIILLMHVYAARSELGERLPVDRVPAAVRVEHYEGFTPAEHPFCAVNVDYTAGIRMLFDHLAETGRRELGLLVHAEANNPWRPGPPSQQTYRAQCIRREADRVGMAGGPERVGIQWENSRSQNWYEATRELLTRHPQIDALLIHNAQTAAPALAAAQDLGRRVGHDLALATYDDPDYSAWLGPGLTVVREPMEAVADALAERILELIDGKRPATQTTIDTELVIRGSTQPGAGASRRSVSISPDSSDSSA